ncbi:N-acetylmuramoyl-L-alanine amidase [Halorhodospira abdelmalekii]|nr:N-acetylmuramoyl-L-alanine amidase [Halorhodospira abdelmalekii]
MRPLRQVFSPNHSQRPAQGAVELLVIHAISLPPGHLDTLWIDRLFTNHLDSTVHPYFVNAAQLRVSAHFLIDRAGALTQYVSLHRQAWHAGRSSFRGRFECNAFSIGIELVGDGFLPYTEAQYAALIRLIEKLYAIYPLLVRERVVGHRDIAPQRKADPGPSFEWTRLDRALTR